MIEKVCVKCGKKAVWYSPVYISPLCEDCAKIEAKKIFDEYACNGDKFYIRDYYQQSPGELNSNALLVTELNVED